MSQADRAKVVRVWLMIGVMFAAAIALLVLAGVLVVAWF